MSGYCFDANIFIQAKNGSYDFDIAPTFWVWLASELDKGNIVSIREVYNELASKGDELSTWVKNRKHYFVEIDKATQQNFRQVASYVMNNYQLAYANDFLSGADPWVVSYCMTHNLTVVTHEQKADFRSKRVKIPNVCHEFKVSWTNLKFVMRQLGCRL